MTAAALWPSGLLVFLTPSLTDCLDLIGKDSLVQKRQPFPTKPVHKSESPNSARGWEEGAGSLFMWEANYF